MHRGGKERGCRASACTWWARRTRLHAPLPARTTAFIGTAATALAALVMASETVAHQVWTILRGGHQPIEVQVTVVPRGQLQGYGSGLPYALTPSAVPVKYTTAEGPGHNIQEGVALVKCSKGPATCILWFMYGSGAEFVKGGSNWLGCSSC